MWSDDIGDFLKIGTIGRPVSSIDAPFIPNAFSARQSYIPKSVSLTLRIIKMCFVSVWYSLTAWFVRIAWSWRVIRLFDVTGMPWWNQCTFACGCDVTTHSNWAFINNLVCTMLTTALISGETVIKKWKNIMIKWNFLQFKTKTETYTKQPYRCQRLLAHQHYYQPDTQFYRPNCDLSLQSISFGYSLVGCHLCVHYISSWLLDVEFHALRTQFRKPSPFSPRCDHLDSKWRLADLISSAFNSKQQQQNYR